MPGVCHVCRNSLDAGAAFCTNCGTAAPRAVPPASARSATGSLGTSPPPTYGQAYGVRRAPIQPLAPSSAYPALRVARAACRVAAVLALLAGVIVIVATLSVGSSIGGPYGASSGLLGAVGFFAFIFACVEAVIFWALGDLITIALRVEATLPPADRVR